MSQIELTHDTVIRRGEALLSNNIGNDIVMMDIEQGSYYGLENVAANIWEMTEQPISVGSLCDKLASQYEVSPEKCEREVMKFIHDLLERKIAEVVT